MTCRLIVLGGSAVSTVQLIDALADLPGGQARRPDGLELVLHGRSGALTRSLTPAGCGPRRSPAHRRSRRAGPGRRAGRGGRGAEPDQGWRPGSPVSGRVVPTEIRHPRRGDHGSWRPGLRRPHDRRAAADLGRGCDRAPAALVINLTNPAGIVQQAARTEAGLRIVTVCDSPLGLLDSVARRLGRPDDEVRSRYVGMNHVGWYVPADLGELDRLSVLACGLDPEVATLHAALPGPYLRYYTHPDRLLASQRGAPTRAEQLLAIQQETMNSYRRGALPATWQRKAPWYRCGCPPDRCLAERHGPHAHRRPAERRPCPVAAVDVIIEGPVGRRSPAASTPSPS